MFNQMCWYPWSQTRDCCRIASAVATRPTDTSSCAASVGLSRICTVKWSADLEHFTNPGAISPFGTHQVVCAVSINANRPHRHIHVSGRCRFVLREVQAYTHNADRHWGKLTQSNPHAGRPSRGCTATNQEQRLLLMHACSAVLCWGGLHATPKSDEFEC